MPQAYPYKWLFISILIILFVGPLAHVLYGRFWLAKFIIFLVLGTFKLFDSFIKISRNSVDDVWKILILFAFIMLVIFEMIRLYLGYIGNLCESVSIQTILFNK